MGLPGTDSSVCWTNRKKVQVFRHAPVERRERYQKWNKNTRHWEPVSHPLSIGPGPYTTVEDPAKSLSPVEAVKLLDRYGVPDNVKQALASAVVEPSENNPRAAYLSTLKWNSAKALDFYLDKSAQLLWGSRADHPWHTLRAEDIELLCTEIRETCRYAPSTERNFLCAVRGVLKQVYLSGDMSKEDYEACCAIRFPAC